MISIDEYTPKIDDTNIVVAFQVLDNFDAAYDLSSFIERSPVEVSDTEASENPNVDGRYVVYAEFERDAEFTQKFLDLLKTIENICPNPEWKLQIYGVNDPVDLDVDAINDNMQLVREKALKEFFDYAPVQVSILKETLQISSVYGSTLQYSLSSGIINEDYVQQLLEQDTSVDCEHLSSILGENYDVLRSGSEYIVGMNGKYVLLR